MRNVLKEFRAGVKTVFGLADKSDIKMQTVDMPDKMCSSDVSEEDLPTVPVPEDYERLLDEAYAWAFEDKEHRICLSLMYDNREDGYKSLLCGKLPEISRILAAEMRRNEDLRKVVKHALMSIE